MKAPAPKAPPPGAEILKLVEVAYVLRCSYSTVCRMIENGSIATVPMGCSRRGVHRSDLDAYLDANRKVEGGRPSTPPKAKAVRVRPSKAGWDGFDPMA